MMTGEGEKKTVLAVNDLSLRRGKKPCSGLASLLLAAGLLLLLCGCAFISAEQDVWEDFLYVNLNDFPLYTKSGFAPPDIAAVPDSGDGSWQIRLPRQQNKPRIVKFLGLETPERFFLSPFAEQVQEYAMLIPFDLSPGQFEKINEAKSPQPGIFLAALGDNWEIFLNGHMIKSEMHLDEAGDIRSHRNWRYVSAPVDRAFFVPGTNMLGFRIVGEPNATDTGLWYGAPYYIARYDTIQKTHHEYILLAFCAVYMFAGLYHLLHYLNQTRDRYNLYYCLFSVLLAVYLLMRGNTIYALIPDSNISFRIEYASLFMLFPVLAAFLEDLSFEKIRKTTLIMGGVSLFLSVLQVVTPNIFRDDILYVWMVFQILEIVYMLVFDMALALYQNIRLQRAAGERSLRTILLNFFIKTPPGNIFLGAAFVAVTAGIDVVQSINMGYGIFQFSGLGLVIFTITTTVILARRFGLLFRRIDEMNTLLEISNQNLEATVRQRTRELELQTEAAESASRAKSDFLARMSHEIRTPLNAILGLSEVELQNKLPGRTRRSLEKIYGSGSLLLELVDDILDISKIESGNFEIFPRGGEFTSLARSWMPYGKALVVGDLETNLEVMKGLLMPYGLRVDTALSGREAVELVRSEQVRYDVIFMDHMMPEMDGIEATRIIRKEIGSPYARQVPIVALTANAVAGSREMFLESGFNDFISKPVDIKRLDSALNRWIRDKQSEETLREAERQAKEQGQLPGAFPVIDGGGQWLLEHPLEGIDFGTALARYGNSGAAYMSILKSFVAHTPLLLEKLDSHLGSASQDYTIEVHGLKGTCNAIAAEKIAALAQELEFASREGNFDLVRQKHGALRAQALELTEGLAVLLGQWAAGQPVEEKEERAEPEQALLARLSAAAGEFNSNATEEILGKLEQYRYQKGQELIEWLREQAENFDYDAMHRRLEELLGAP
jgi:CheY-like chemotaxis protein/HPt (histidine-containing phosphotransfer) domain-containing protein